MVHPTLNIQPKICSQFGISYFGISSPAYSISALNIQMLEYCTLNIQFGTAQPWISTLKKTA